MKKDFKKLLSYVITVGILATNINFVNDVTVHAANSDEYGFNQGNYHPNGTNGSSNATDHNPYFNRNLYDKYLGYGINQTPNALMVDATATSAVSYQWLADGAPIIGATSYMYYPSTADPGNITYSCIATNIVTGHSTVSSQTTVVVSSEYGIETPIISEQYAQTITYLQYETPADLVIAVDPRINGSLTYTWYCTNLQTNETTAVSSGHASQMSNIYLSVKPQTSATGTYLYYCDVVNEYDNKRVNARSMTATVIVSNRHDPSTIYSAVKTDGTLLLKDNEFAYLDYNSLNNYVHGGGKTVQITGHNILSLRVPATLYSDGYTMQIHDTATGLNYSWKIRYGNTVASNLDLALTTTSSLGFVDKSSTNLDFTPSLSQAIKFQHSGSLNSDGSTMTLYLPTSVEDGPAWLYKLSGPQILLNTEVQASINNGVLTANLSSCSDWVISSNRLVTLSTETQTPIATTTTTTTNSTISTPVATTSAVTTIPTDARVSVPQFNNVVSGTVINLSNINVSSAVPNYRFEGWFYDTAYTNPVSSSDLSSLTITNSIITNGLYPKFTFYNTSVPDVAYPVPSTNTSILSRLF